MQRLIQEGLLRSERNRGLFVIGRPGRRAGHLPRARRDRTRRRDADPAERTQAGRAIRLAPVHREMKAAARRSDYTALSDAELRFQELLVAQSGSKRLARMYAALLVESRMWLTAMQDTYRFPDEAVKEHGAFVTAVRSADAVRLSQLIDAHTQDAVQRLAPPSPNNRPASGAVSTAPRVSRR